MSYAAKLATFAPHFPSAQQRKTPDDGDRKDLERELGARLPDAYWAFVCEFGGASLRDALIDYEGGTSDVHAFHGFSRDDESDDLIGVFQTFADRIPRGMLPIGADSGGNHWCLVVRGALVGQVIFWNHDGWRDAEEIPEWLAERIEEELKRPDVVRGLKERGVAATASWQKRWRIAHREQLDVPWWECIYRVAPTFEAFLDALHHPAIPTVQSARVRAILDAIGTGAKHELEGQNGRTLVRVTHADGARQLSFLNKDELAELERALAAR